MAEGTQDSEAGEAVGPVAMDAAISALARAGGSALSANLMHKGEFVGGRTMAAAAKRGLVTKENGHRGWKRWVLTPAGFDMAKDFILKNRSRK